MLTSKELTAIKARCGKGQIAPGCTGSHRLNILLMSGSFPNADESWSFITASGIIKLHGRDVLLRSLLPLCDGTLSREQISSRISNNLEHDGTAAEVIDFLFAHRILVEVQHVHQAVSNFLQVGSVAEFPAEAVAIEAAESATSLPPLAEEGCWQAEVRESTLGVLVALRRTSYTFDSQALQFAELSNLLWCMYGRQSGYADIFPPDTMSVPSGGGLYGLRIDLVLLKEVPPLSRGHYLWRHKDTCFQRLDTNLQESAAGLFSPSVDFGDATGILFISADLDRLAKKYGGKCYPLALLEAGHAMQNAYLFCAQEDLGFAEIFGIDHLQIESLISHGGIEFQTLVGAIFGKPSQTAGAQQ